MGKHRYKKRKIIATVALSLSLLFGKTRLSSSQSSNSNLNNKIAEEKIINNIEFCEDNDQQLILNDIGYIGAPVPASSGPRSNFCTPPAAPARTRTGQSVYVTKYRTAPNVVPGPGLGVAANPGGGVVMMMVLLNLTISLSFEKIRIQKNQDLTTMILV